MHAASLWYIVFISLREEEDGTYNEKKKITNSRYLAKFRTVTLRITDAEKTRIEEAAADQGESVAGYIMTAIRRRMAGEE